MFTNENNPHECQDTEFKRTIIIFIKECKEFKEDPKKQLSEIKGKQFRENKPLCDAPENTNVKQKQMRKTTQNLKMEFSKKSTWAEMKIKLKTLITQPENSKENLARQMSRAEDTVSGLKVVDLSCVNKDYDKH